MKSDVWKPYTCSVQSPTDLHWLCLDELPFLIIFLQSDDLTLKIIICSVIDQPLTFWSWRSFLNKNFHLLLFWGWWPAWWAFRPQFSVFLQFRTAEMLGLCTIAIITAMWHVHSMHVWTCPGSSPDPKCSKTVEDFHVKIYFVSATSCARAPMASFRGKNIKSTAI